MDLVELKKYCDMYDSERGKWTESIYEGEAVYAFIESKIKSSNIDYMKCQHVYANSIYSIAKCIYCGDERQTT